MGKQWDDYDWQTGTDLWAGTGINIPPDIKVKVLSVDPETGARTSLLSVPPGWRTPAPEYHSVGQEDILVEGEVMMGEVKLEAPAYMYFPPGQVHGPRVSETGCTMLSILDGKFDITYT